MTLQCPVCQITMSNSRHAWLFTCQRCGMQASNLMPDIESGSRGMVLDEDVRHAGLDPVRAENGRRLITALGEARGRSLLDVGCGPGFFLELAHTCGFAAEGVEPDVAVADRAARKGVVVHKGFFPMAVNSDRKYDVIIFNDVLEHIPDLPPVFEGISRHLAPGGTLILNCPDRSGAFYRVASALDRIGISKPFGRMWQMGLPSPHVWYFTRQQLRTLAERHGLRFRRDVELITVSRRGLFHRVAYVKGQGGLFNFMTYVAVWLLVPLLGILPRDSGAVMFQKD